MGDGGGLMSGPATFERDVDRDECPVCGGELETDEARRLGKHPACRRSEKRTFQTQPADEDG